MAFDLPAYLKRIALEAPPEATVEGLLQLQRAHRLAIPFENLDAILRRPIRIDSDAVFTKLVTASRGGFCFEQNRLFLDALAALGFSARPLLGRVRLGSDEVTARTHVLSLVEVEGEAWLADVGFGAAYAPPMRLSLEAVEEAPDGALFRLQRDAVHGWVLQRRGPSDTTDGRGAGEGWVDQYSFTKEPVFDADLLMSAYYAATIPGGRFATYAIVTMPLPTGFASLVDRRYRRRNGDQAVDAMLDDPRVYRIRLGMLFGIQLDADEVTALGLFGGGDDPQ